MKKAIAAIAAVKFLEKRKRFAIEPGADRKEQDHG